METASIGLPTVNVGERQRGRTRPGNVIDTPAEASAIRSAIEHARSPGFRSSLQGLENPYGDGHAGERIARILAEAPERGVLLHKRALPLSATGFDHD
jgi:UDP-N-acetylglucosamine 2-epimerase